MIAASSCSQNTYRYPLWSRTTSRTMTDVFPWSGRVMEALISAKNQSRVIHLEVKEPCARRRLTAARPCSHGKHWYVLSSPTTSRTITNLFPRRGRATERRIFAKKISQDSSISRQGWGKRHTLCITSQTSVLGCLHFDLADNRSAASTTEDSN